VPEADGPPPSEPDDTNTADDDDTTWVDDDDDDDDDMVGDDDDATWGDDDDAAGDDDDDDDDGDDDDSVSGDDDDSMSEDVCDEAFEAPQTRFLSADDSNSQADPAHIRAQLAQGNVPSSAKPWEYLNYYDFDYTPADPGQLRIEPQLLEDPNEPGAYDLLVAVVAPDVAPSDRAPLNLVFSVDTSCSMGGQAIEMERASLEAIAASLQQGDVVSMVTWSATASTMLDSFDVTGPNDPTLLNQIANLAPGGGTDLNGGLVAAYDLANANYDPSRTNRVVLFSDGGANLGVTSEQLIAQNALSAEGQGIYLAGVGMGAPMSYNDVLMDEVTDVGKGAYLFIDTAAEATERFAPERLPSVFELAALDVQLAVTLPPGFVVDEFTGEEIGNTPSEVEPQHLAPNDQMLYDMDLLDCSADAASSNLELEFTVEWTHPGTNTPMIETLMVPVGDLLQEPARELVKASALVSFAQAFEEVASLSGASARGAYLDDVLDEVQSAVTSFPSDPDLPEVLSQLQVWRAMYP